MDRRPKFHEPPGARHRRHTPRAIPRPDKLPRKRDGIRRAGYAIVDQELKIGLRSIAVPVRDHAGKVVAAMDIGTHASRASLAEMETTLLRELEATANEPGSSLIA
jgi:IclR family transcriptional regulator, pca regulon regulatory protein